MGMTFGNFHVYKGNQEQIFAILKNKHTVVELSPDWVTVVDEFAADQSQKAARSVSKSIEQPVLHFYYFDDDVITLSLFQQGKCVASYWMDYAGQGHIKKIGLFISLLGLDSSCEKRLRAVLKFENLGKKISLLEELFGVALYVDHLHLQGEETSYLRMRDDKLYTEYLTEQKKLKIKNQTTATLLQEIDAKMNLFHEGDTDIFFFNYKDEDDIYPHQWGGTLVTLSDGAFTPLFSKDIHFYCQSNMTVYTDDEIVNIVWDKYEPELEEFNKPLIITIDRKRYDVEERLIRLNREGDLISTVDLPREYKVIGGGTTKEDVFCSIPSQSKQSLLRLHKGAVVWKTDLDIDYFWTQPFLYEGYIYYSDRLQDGGTLYKLDLDGNVVKNIYLNCIRNSNELFFCRGYIYYLGDLYQKGQSFHVMLKLDQDLNVIQTKELPQTLQISYIDDINESLNKIYCSGYGRSTFAFDTDSLEYTEKKQPFSVSRLQTAGKNGEYLLFPYLSTLYVLDADMNLLSKHRLKGSIYQIRTINNHIYVVTGTGDISCWGSMEGSCHARLYSINNI